MNFQEFKNSPTVFKILVMACIALLLYMIFSFCRSLQFSHNIARSLIQILLWIAITIGFYLAKKWAWVIFAVLTSFSILSLVHVLVSQRMPFNIFSLFSIIIGSLVLLGLNTKSVRELFQIDSRKEQIVAVEVTNFAILCVAIGMFIFIEILGISRITFSSIPAKLFIGFIGFIHILLGIGIWRLEKYAFQAALSFLAFTTISVSIILVHDFIEANRFLALNKSIFYITISLAMLIYWTKFVRTKIP